jgi:hypothetical protein
MKLKRNAGWLGCLVALFYLTGCSGGNSGEYKTADQLKKEQPAAAAGHDEHDHAGHDHDHDHEHAAKHGGELLEIGDHVAHVELVVDAGTGAVTAYVLDAHAEKPLALEQKELALTLTPEAAEAAEGQEKTAPAPITLELKPAEGDTAEAPAGSVFTGQSDQLKGADHLDAVIGPVQIGDKKFEKIEAHVHPVKAAE